MKVEFGYNRGLPESVTTAWGARVIAYGDSFDLVPDRQVVSGPRKDELLEYLNKEVPFAVLSRQADKVRGDSDDKIVFFEDAVVIVKGSAQRSFGYCYIVAYFKDEAHDNPQR